jgi:hypothetical protein
MNPIDPPSLLPLERLKWDGTADVSSPRKERAPRHPVRVKFLKGPVPLPWLALAGRQPGKALHVAVALWFLAGVTKSSTVALSNEVLATFGVNRRAGHRGLTALERAGLVAVERHRGRQPRVTVLAGPEASP